MEEQRPPHVRIDYLVGAERKLAEIVTASEILPLLQGMVDAGARRAALLDGEGVLLWSRGEEDKREGVLLSLSRAITLEGEPAGAVLVQGAREEARALGNLAGLLQTAITTILVNNLKRMLTTEIHTTVVNQSYDELLAANRQLAASEARYRLLAAQLESKVAERTAAFRHLHAQLLIQEKMAAVGQLAAGLAHEINNPLGFITSNVNSLQKYVARFTELISFYHEIFNRIPVEPATVALVTEKRRRLKYDFIESDVVELLLQTRGGCQRIQEIIVALKGFSHLDDESPEVAVDLNRELDQTLKVLHQQIPENAVIEKSYAPLPPYLCRPAQLCLAFYNIIRNAIQAKPDGLRLQIGSEFHPGEIRVVFADNGPGMPPEICRRVFEPFFTTKEAGAGTGLGLTTAYETVTTLGGRIEVESQPGQGTKIIITFPLKDG